MLCALISRQSCEVQDSHDPQSQRKEVPRQDQGRHMNLTVKIGITSCNVGGEAHSRNEDGARDY